MMEWLKQYISETPQSPTEWLVVAILVAILLILLHSLYRRLTGGLYIAGGRSRKARLAVMDAAPVDNHRRLVLVRRDDVEHLVMIGGAGDIVIEQNIRIGAPAGRQRSILDDNALLPTRDTPVVDTPAAVEPPVAMPQPAPAERRRPVPQPQRAVAPMAERPPVRARDWMRGGKAETPAAAPAAAFAPTAAPEPVAPTVAPPVEIAPEASAAPALEPVPVAEPPAPEIPAVSPSPAVETTPVAEQPVAAPAQSQGFSLRPFRRANTVANDAPNTRIFGQPKPVETPKPAAAAPAKPAAPANAAKVEGNLEDEMERLLNELTGTNN